MQRVKAVIMYDGGYFKGFQKQNSTNKTVTTQIELTLNALGINSNIRGSGRTDAGVHATGQVIDFLIPDFWNNLNRLKFELNRKLQYISFKHISFVNSNFHSRFSAKKRVYRYIFKTSLPSIFERNYISHYQNFNTKLLEESLNIFKGEHDFSNFIKTGSYTHTNIRYIYNTYYKTYNDKYHIIYFEANGFLRSQVRMMVEASMQVSQNKLSLKELEEQLLLKKRYITKLAPPQGLYLARIIY